MIRIITQPHQPCLSNIPASDDTQLKSDKATFGTPSISVCKLQVFLKHFVAAAKIYKTLLHN